MENSNTVYCMFCSKKIPAQDFQNHKHCKHCKAVQQACYLENHEAWCTSNTVKCQQCAKSIQKQEFKKHKCNTVYCLLCSKQIPKQDFHNHKHCKHCKAVQQASDLENHEAWCTSNTVICQHCGKSIQAQEYQDHKCDLQNDEAESTCNTVYCVFCSKKIPEQDFQNHKHCKHCNEVQQPCDLQMHEAWCTFNKVNPRTSNTVYCVFCSQKIPEQDFPTHKHCKHCNAVQQACDLQNHEASCSKRFSSEKKTTYNITPEPPVSKDSVIAAADSHIRRIKRNLRGSKGSILKKALRTFQLEFHPDKTKVDQAVAHVVFCFVQGEWDKSFK